MISVRKIAEDIVRREGGYVNDPDDPGGATNFGVTIGTVKRLGLDKNRDGAVNIADVKALTRDDAIDIFMKQYFEVPRINLLPQSIQASVFDMNVNAGNNAVKILQRLVRLFGLKTDVDGSIGPKTVKVCQLADEMAPDHFFSAYGIARRQYYFALADRRAASRKYARTVAGGKGGWIKRAEEFIEPKYHLTDAEFRGRISAWG